MKKTKEITTIMKLLTTALSVMMALLMIAAISVSGQTAFEEAAKKACMAGYMAAMQSNGTLEPVTNTMTSVPSQPDYAELITLIADNIEQSKLSNTTYAVRTSASNVTSTSVNGIPAYSITLPVRILLPSGKSDSQRITVYAPVAAQAGYTLQELSITKQGTEELVNIQLPYPSCILIFDYKHDGDANIPQPTTPVAPTTVAQPTTAVFPTTVAQPTTSIQHTSATQPTTIAVTHPPVNPHPVPIPDAKPVVTPAAKAPEPESLVTQAPTGGSPVTGEAAFYTR